MRRKIYTFDAAAMGMRKFTHSVWSVLRVVLGVLLVSVSLFILFYLITSLFVSTDTEKLLRTENKMYEKADAELPQRQKLLEDAVAVLQQKDSRIYEEVFHTKAPEMDPVSRLDFAFGADTIPDAKIVTYTTRKADALLGVASEVDASFERIYRMLGSGNAIIPPMTMPVSDVSYPQVGASAGMHLNPFYKVDVEHHGLDVIVPQGTPVKAPDDGTVTEVVRASKGDGNVLSIQHAGDYTTRYLHLGEIYVSVGQKVRKGSRIASVGMSGNSYAPHLHYEVLKEGQYCNPVDFLFGSIAPKDYANILFMSINTRQSMD